MNQIPTGLHGVRLLSSPAWNKGTAFSEEERTRLGLHGLLPPYVETLDEQVVRAFTAYRAYDKPMNRHIYLRQLQDNNEVLFYRLLLDHVEETMPIVYTPTVAEACAHFSHIYRRPRGLFISYPLRESIPELLRNRPHPDVDVMVVTDGERILGIGDQGVGGLGIPIGKLSLYSLIGGIHPARTLPIVLDVGTNNEDILRDPTYLGWHHSRIVGVEYDDFIDRFVKAVKQELPETCLQWEDFATPHARTILDRYRDDLLTFNDDIQGTGAVALGAILSAVKVTGKSMRDQRVVFLGAGSASIGVADYLRAAMVEEGLSEREARDRFWIVDKDGLLHLGRPDPDARAACLCAPRFGGNRPWGSNRPDRSHHSDRALDRTRVVHGPHRPGNGSQDAAADYHAAVEPHRTVRSDRGGPDSLDGRASFDRDRLAIRAGALRRPNHPDRPVQQRVYFSRHRLSRRGRSRAASYRRNAPGRRPSPGGSFAGAEGPSGQAASFAPGFARRNGGDRVRHWTGSATRGCRPRIDA